MTKGNSNQLVSTFSLKTSCLNCTKTGIQSPSDIPVKFFQQIKYISFTEKSYCCVIKGGRKLEFLHAFPYLLAKQNPSHKVLILGWQHASTNYSANSTDSLDVLW